MKWKVVFVGVAFLALVAVSTHLLTRDHPPAPLTDAEHMKLHAMFGHETTRKVIVQKCGQPDLVVVGGEVKDAGLPESVLSYMVYRKKECDFVYGFDSKRKLVYMERVEKQGGRE